ncbi:hypothetical protein GUJ93_ZPchr0002g23234 [Zizania palustris]|uniref:Uncharacterized protein n=1 Tax=Zizania palustris TaxID=103762 RepID=A0A8J5SMN6_ZIZPA|nr:hypothetical protein GUJ93_ZPchr0002g23234 [Zizania palustris]
MRQVTPPSSLLVESSARHAVISAAPAATPIAAPPMKATPPLSLFAESPRRHLRYACRCARRYARHRAAEESHAAIVFARRNLRYAYRCARRCTG